MPLHTFERRLAATWPTEEWRDVSVMAAVSGGADSVALLRALAALKQPGRGRLLAAHFNHGLRAEADADESFVRQLAAELNLTCETGSASPELAEQGDSLEAAARDARYEFLQAAAERTGARFVAVAHTADDQAETILHRVLRGTGLPGLAGMPRARPLGQAVSLLRPLLDFRRAEIVEYLDHLGQPFRQDASNDQRRFTRNRIRHDLLPLLEQEYNPQVRDALLRLGSLSGEAQAVMDRLVEQLADHAFVQASEEEIQIRCPPLADQPAFLVREFLAHVWRRAGWPLQAMDYEHWQRLANMAMSESSAQTKRTFPSAIEVERCGETLWLRAVTVHR